MFLKYWLYGFVVTIVIFFVCVRDRNVQDGVYNGSANMRSKKFKNLKISGSASLQDIRVKNKLSVSGSLSAEESVFGQVAVSGSVNMEDVNINGPLSISGSCNLEDCNILGEMRISGGLNMRDCKIAKDIHVSSIEVTIHESIVKGSVYMKSSLWWLTLSKTQKLRLDDAKVHGDIIFESEGGIIELRGDAKILGKVVNATVVCK